jgi:hypothetical protein
MFSCNILLVRSAYIYECCCFVGRLLDLQLNFSPIC